MSHESKIKALKDRAYMLSRARLFFSERNILEVDTPLLSSSAPIDQHIDVMSVSLPGGQKGFLHTSPEYAMKRLISIGLTDIYQLSHVFREGEIGTLHNPEFTMVEWYRKGCTFEELMADTIEFIQLFLGDLSVKAMSYREVLLHFAGLDYLHAKTDALISCIEKNHLEVPMGASSWDKDTLLQYIMSFAIEPLLGKEELFIVHHFPASQAALSQTTWKEDEHVAERFEVYFQGIELANGYHELTDAIEQRRRLHLSNQKRKDMGKEELVIDELFLRALEKGLPDCCGVAVGFDRLMLLRHQKNHIKEVIPFAWNEV